MRGTYDTPKRSHVIKTRLDDEEYKFFLLKCKWNYTCSNSRGSDSPCSAHFIRAIVFIERIQKYTALEELTPYVAHELIKAIYVGAPDKSSGKRRQSIHIEYDLIGFIPLNELMKQETA